MPGYNITVTIVSYRMAKHSHVCFTPPDNNHPGRKNHRTELPMNREMHMISLSPHMYVCVYIDRDIRIYIATSTCACMQGEYAHAQDERGQIAHLPLTVIPPTPRLPTKRVPAVTPWHRAGDPKFRLKIPANGELRFPHKHFATACSALGSGAGRGSAPRRKPGWKR